MTQTSPQPCHICQGEGCPACGHKGFEAAIKSEYAQRIKAANNSVDAAFLRQEEECILTKPCDQAPACAGTCEPCGVEAIEATNKATHEHRMQVARLIDEACSELVDRAEHHDLTKMRSPEVEIFAEYTPKLKATTYGSDEYRGYLKEMQVALDHHYRANRHHPEHFEQGIRGMTLVDLIEMICDWMAATMRHADGDIVRSIRLNKQRFGYSDELEAILLNTVTMLGGSANA
jgi:hypothetical protein